jgi:HSP20 family molecular chaperone IbpA
MPDLTLWKTRQLSRMKQEIDQMFGELYRQFGASELAHGQELFFPEIIETKDELTVVFDLSDFDPKNIEVLADENTLRLRVSTNEELLDTGQHLKGRQSFSGTLRLPCRVMPEKAAALIKDGRLHITLPKCRPGGLHKIEVKHV